MYRRILDLSSLLRETSIFLFGPRQVGKSTMLRTAFPEATYVDLLEADTFRELSARPETLRQTLPPGQRLVIVDEVQKLPGLLDEVHLLIERNRQLRFILTGSSARSLKRGRANLLAGRAWTCRLHPLVAPEVEHGRLHDRLERGSLPAVLDSSSPREMLRAYVGTYLQEEILAEGLSRNLGNFSRFLEVAALTNGEQVNFTAVGSDAGVPPRTVREYYRVLEDTLVGHQLPAFGRTLRRKPVATAKFYLFDVGVANALVRRWEVPERSESHGRALEHLVFLELRSYLDTRRSEETLTFWRTRTGLEVDFVIGDRIGIEVKAGGHVTRRDTHGLLALAEEVDLKRRIVVATERQRRLTDDGVEVVPVEDFLRDLWGGALAE
jgi:predicted AAA+ superfamily ATPase